ncbi:30S ribosomal protein S6 [bacterium]|jgi:small subunit ribosomal protein S6|nr:30S ribosomal protein S6 [bacterium]MBR6243969.1 30S ribosomal protein S6 [bacterium]
MKRSHYEITAILRPEGSPETIKQFAERVDEIIKQYEGTVLTLQSWGERKLAYEIKKNLKGYYLLFDVIGDGKMVEEIERNFNIWENVLKFMSIKVDKEENIDALLASAKGIESLFDKSERHENSENGMNPAEDEGRGIEDTKRYNEELQKSLGTPEEEENVEL